MSRYHRLAGVLGGMGPEATAVFLQRLVSETNATRDQDHLPTLVLSDPLIPDRTAHILGRGESPVTYLVERARRLEGMGAELIAIPCNTAHFYWLEIKRSVRIPVLHIVRETVDEICAAGLVTSSNSIGILATRGTIATGLYHTELNRRGMAPMQPGEHIQDQIQQSINWLKSRQRRRDSVLCFQNAIDDFCERGASAVIFGCTEIGLVTDELELKLPAFDSLTALARATIRDARAPADITGEDAL